MPLLRPRLLRAVAAACEDVDIAMARLDGVAQPLLAAYRPSIVPQATQLLDEGDGRIRALLPLVRHQVLEVDELRVHDPEHESFTNINHPEDLNAVEQALKQRIIRQTGLNETDQHRTNPIKSDQIRTVEGPIRCRCSDES